MPLDVALRAQGHRSGFLSLTVGTVPAGRGAARSSSSPGSGAQAGPSPSLLGGTSDRGFSSHSKGEEASRGRYRLLPSRVDWLWMVLIKIAKSNKCNSIAPRFLLPLRVVTKPAASIYGECIACQLLPYPLFYLTLASGMVLLIRRGNRGTERLSNLLKVTQLAKLSTGLITHILSHSKALHPDPTPQLCPGSPRICGCSGDVGLQGGALGSGGQGSGGLGSGGPGSGGPGPERAGQPSGACTHSSWVQLLCGWRSAESHLPLDCDGTG